MFIIVLVTVVLAYRFYNSTSLFYVFRANNLELRWTILPAVRVFRCAFPRVMFLYAVETLNHRTIYSVIRNQWYWSYKMTRDLYDSIYYNRNLTTVMDCMNRVSMWRITSNDVIHNWGVARRRSDSMRMKMDAYPRRLNLSCAEMMTRRRLFLRYCSELCRAHHAYMPIAVAL